MKKAIGFLSVLMTAGLLAGCGSKEVANTAQAIDLASQAIAETTETAETAEGATETSAITFTDDLDREITVDSPERVVTLLGSFCDEWLLAGGSVVGSANDTFTNYDFGFEDQVVDIGSTHEPDVEKILSVQPDFVIASAKLDAQVELKDTFEKAGITVAYLDVDDFGDYLRTLDIFTQITGEKENYDKYGTEVSKEIEEAKAKIDGRKPTVLFIRAAASSVKVKGSKGTIGGEILADLDTENIADSNSLLEDLSMEAIIAADPDYIFVTTQGSDLEAALANVDELMISNPAWNSLKAVKNGNYYVLDKLLYNSKPNARWGEAYNYLADILYKGE